MEKKRIGPVSMLGYVIVLAAGFALVVMGGKDLLLLVVGRPVSAKITSVDTRQSGRRRGGSQTTIQYKYQVNGATYDGSGPWHGQMMAMMGDKAAVRYLGFAPSASAPEDALVGPGLILLAIGGILIAVDASFFLKRWRGEHEPKGAKPPKQRQRGKAAA
jgi:hypothetical protein